MEGLKLSIDIIARDLGDQVVAAALNAPHGMTIARFEIYREDTFLLDDRCLYLCLDERLPPANRIRSGTGIICVDPACMAADGIGDRANLLAVDGMDAAQLVNAVAAIFDRYRPLGQLIELYAENGESLGDLLDAGQKLVGAPLCVIDTNADIVAASTAAEPFANPLWETIEQDRKQTRCDILDHHVENFGPSGESRPAPTQNAPVRTLMLSGFEMVERDLVRRGHRAASLWAFQTKPGKKFSLAQQQLFGWLADRLGCWANRSHLLKAGRGLPSERFLIDLVDGAFSTEHDIAEAAQRAGADVIDSPEHQLLMLRPAETALRTERHLAMLESVEATLPASAGVLVDQGIIVLIRAEENGYLTQREQQALDQLCAQMGYRGLLGTPYRHLSDTPRVARQLADSFATLHEDSCKLYHYYDCLVVQSMRLVIANQPPETLLHPMIRRLAAYDSSNHTDYLETFKTYLNNRCNATETAQQLHMHRNTLLHRIKRIEELLDSTFEDWNLRRVLLFSIDYLNLINRGSI